MKTILGALGALLVISPPAAFAQNSATGANTAVVQANVKLMVETGTSVGVVARAHIEFLDHYRIVGKAAPWRDSAGRYILDATVEPLAVIAVYPPPPTPVADLTYQLGVLPPGSHTVLFRMNGKVFADKHFTVPGTQPGAQVGLEVFTTNTGSVAKARVVFPDGYWHLTDPGAALRDGNLILIDARASRIETLVPPSGPAVFEPQYPLGVLPAGKYAIRYRINGALAAEHPFEVGGAALAQLSFIHFRQGDVSMAAEVGVTVPAGTTVLNWGEVVKDGTTFRVSLTFGPQNTEANSVGRVLANTYPLGLVSPGSYRMQVKDAVSGRLLGTREFSVGPMPPPPPPPAPVVAYIQPSQGTAGWFVEVGLALPRPDIAITDWGVPTREGNRFAVNIRYAAATTGGTAVSALQAIEPPPAVDASVTAQFSEISGWPVRLLRHRYELGALQPGEHVFSVALNGRDAAKRGFVVPEVQPQGPAATLFAPPIETAKTEPHGFRIVFNAPAGWDGDPSRGAVTVNGPDGFPGVAILVSAIPSLDPLGRIVDCRYELAAPGGAWDAADSGVYRVCIDPTAVVDRNGKTVPRPCIGDFPVKILPPLPPVPPEREAKVEVEMRDGRWFANVSFENTAGWLSAGWGEPHVNGNVFAAKAELRLPPSGSLAPIPASFTHVYPLGSPPPGSYAFLFRSSAGHVARTTFIVPGVEPPSLSDAWATNTNSRPGPGLDDDGDGWPNLAEFYLCMRPLVPDQPVFQQKVVTRDGRRHFAIAYKRPTGVEAPVKVCVEVSRDMVKWTDACDLVDWVTGDPDPDGTDTIEAVQKAEIAAREWPYMRIRVMENP